MMDARRTRRRLAMAALCLAVGLQAGPALAAGNIGVVLGERSMSDGDVWREGAPFDLDLTKQGAAGFTADLGKPRWPVRFSFGFFQSRGNDEDSVRTRVSFPSTGTFLADVDLELKSVLTEMSFGVLKSWRKDSATRPFVEGGLTMMRATLQTTVRVKGSGNSLDLSEDEQDSEFGFYVQTGVLWRIGPRFNLGVNARAVLGSKLEVKGLRPIDGSADYVQAALSVGWGWP